MENRDKEILKHLDAGLSMGATARKLGISKGVVAGVKFRNKEPALRRKIMPQRWHRDPPPFTGRGIPLEELSVGKGCRYPYGDSVPFGFCGKPGFPWCEEHYPRIYQLRKVF
jgi:hypothetical protein